MEPLRVGVIGRTGRGDYGHWLDVVWLKIPEVRVVAVADDDPAGLAAATERLGVTSGYADYREMLDREDLDIVSVAPRWLDGHRDMVLGAMAHGCHVLVEKPLALDLQQADEIVAACEAQDLKLAIAHHTHYSPTVQRIHELIADGRIGDIVEIRGRGKEDVRAGCEDFMLLGSHILDLFRVFLGEPRWCQARITEHGRRVTAADIRPGGEQIGPVAGDRVEATYGFDGPALARFSTLRGSSASGWRFGLEILGTKGVIDIQPGSLPKARLLDDPLWGRGSTDWHPISSAGVDAPEPIADDGLRLANHWMASDLVAAIREDRQPACNVYDARSTLEMVMAAYESHRLGTEVTFPMVNRVNPLSQLGR